MNLETMHRKEIIKLIKENLDGLQEYFGKQGGYKFVRNMEKEVFEEQLMQWILNVRRYMKKYKKCNFVLEEIFMGYVKIENLKNK